MTLITRLETGEGADRESWYCDQCHIEVRQLRCPHCGKTKREAK